MQKPLVLTKLQNLLQGFKEKFVGTKIGISNIFQIMPCTLRVS